LYYLPLTDIVQGVDWSANQLRLGLALKWSPVPGNDPIRRQERLEIIDTIRIEVAPVLAGYKRGTESATQEITESGDLIITTDIVHRTDSLFTALPVAEKKVVVEKPQKKKSALAATITASGLESDGRETQDIKIEVEEFTSVLMTPLLNYIFFEENSATLQPKYKQLDKNGIEKFREDKVNNPDRLTTYYQILNIIGKRMKINNDAMLTLTGCNADIGLEKGNGDVSKRRAEAVKSYLMDKWGIPESRIKVQQRNLPLKAANTQTPDGAQENRRVEFTSNNPAITAPVITNDTLRTVSPPSVRFRSQVITDNAISKWSLVAEQDSRTLKRFDGTGTVPKIMDWNIDEEKGTQPQTKSSLKYKLDVTDATDEHVDSENDIAVDQILISHKRAERIADKEIKRFSLILFDIRSTEITSANGSIIDLIKNEIKPNSKVTVTGYTDRLGDASTNKSLAEERAQNTATAIGIPSKQPNVVGKGNAATYNADVPEGRLYTRTVDVVVETPVK